MDKLKARLITDDSQQGRHQYFVSSGTVSLQVVLLLCNIASNYKYSLHTVHIQRACLNAEFTSADARIYLHINSDVVPFWILQNPAKPVLTELVELLLLIDRLLQ